MLDIHHQLCIAVLETPPYAISIQWLCAVVIGASVPLVVKSVENSTGFSVEDNLVVCLVTDPPSDDPPRIQ